MITSRQSRETSPMPYNIDQIKDNLPPDSIYVMNNRNLIPFPVQHLVRRFGRKILYGLGTIGGMYGAYKLGQHFQPKIIPNSNKKRTNRTRSGA